MVSSKATVRPLELTPLATSQDALDLMIDLPRSPTGDQKVSDGADHSGDPFAWIPEPINAEGRVVLEEMNELRNQQENLYHKFFEQTLKTQKLQREIASLKQNGLTTIKEAREEARQEARREFEDEVDKINRQVHAADTVTKWCLTAGCRDQTDKHNLQQQLADSDDRYNKFTVRYGSLIGQLRFKSIDLERKNSDLQHQVEFQTLNNTRLESQLQYARDKLEAEKQVHDRTWRSARDAKAKVIYLSKIISRLDPNWIGLHDQLEMDGAEPTELEIKTESDLDEKEVDSGEEEEEQPQWDNEQDEGYEVEEEEERWSNEQNDDYEWEETRPQWWSDEQEDVLGEYTQSRIESDEPHWGDCDEEDVAYEYVCRSEPDWGCVDIPQHLTNSNGW